MAKLFFKYLFLLFVLFSGSVEIKASSSHEASFQQEGFEKHPLVQRLHKTSPKLTHHILTLETLTVPNLETVHAIDENDALVNYEGKQPFGTVGIIYCIGLFVPHKKSLYHMNEYCHRDKDMPLTGKMEEFFAKIEGISFSEEIHLVTRHISERLLQMLQYLEEKGHTSVTLHTYKGVFEEFGAISSLETGHNITLYGEFERRSVLTYSSIEKHHPRLNVFIDTNGKLIIMSGDIHSPTIQFPSLEFGNRRFPHRPYRSAHGKLNYLSAAVVVTPELELKDNQLWLK